MKKINKYRLQKLLIILALGGVYYIFMKLTGLGIPCPVRLISGGRLLCPGCGISRMCMNLGSLSIYEAFHCNPVVFSLIPLWSICTALWLFNRDGKFLKAAEIFSVIVLILFGIFRNFL